MDSSYTYYSCNDTGDELVHDLVREKSGHQLQSYAGEEVWTMFSEDLREKMVPINVDEATALKAKLDSFADMAFMPDETNLDVDLKDRFGFDDKEYR